ncbi:hypothetical protein [Aeromicrobium sp. CF3.5]|uniref:hypothetical protein n=1 Tax=Aeromicrobium sp. CF3.5 TaxID=3373078 RepID=UPI003EE4B47D
MTKMLATLCAVAALTLTSACGGGGGRPAADEISTALQAEGNVLGTALPAEAADCVGTALEGSELSDQTLQALVDGDEDYQNSDDEDVLLGDLAAEVSECVAP